jgi:hypothetical protein
MCTWVAWTWLVAKRVALVPRCRFAAARGVLRHLRDGRIIVRGLFGTRLKLV